jgi:hypothetical protein
MPDKDDAMIAEIVDAMIARFMFAPVVGLLGRYNSPNGQDGAGY